MSDLIDREKAVDTVVEAMMDGADADMVEGLLYLLPSAEPEIIRCKECKHRFLQNQIWQCPFTIPASENHFCGYAERRTDE